MNDINFIGQTTFRNEEKRFGIKLDDRRRHLYVIGKTGMGKTQLLINMAVQDILAGHGVGFVDPHGEAAEKLLEFVPKERVKDVVYFNPADRDFPISFNVMEKVDVEHRHLVASGLMGVFKKIWPDVWSARMEYILHNSILALLEHPTTTLLGVNRMLVDTDYRARVVEKITDPVVRAFWEQEFARYTQRYEVEATAAIQNKIGQFISAPLIRNIIGQVESSIDMRWVMDEKKIFIMNLSKGRIGEDASKLLGGLLITKLQLAAMSRVDIPEEERPDFFLYVDEFQNFATESFANILSEARKYRLDLTLGHQYIAQMEETVRDAVFGNVGTLLCFRVGAEDAEFLEREFMPVFTAQDLVNLPKYHIYLKLIIDGVASNPFSARTLQPFPDPLGSPKQAIVEYTRSHYAAKREKVEVKIATWTGSFANQQPPQVIQQPETYEIQCQKCGKLARVPFKPEPGRPVFCKSCRKKMDQERDNQIHPAGPEVHSEAKQHIERFPKPSLVKPPLSVVDEKEADQDDQDDEDDEDDEDNRDNKDNSSFSLEDLLAKRPIAFSHIKTKEAEKTDSEKERLKQALRQSLKEAQQKEPEKKSLSEQVKKSLEPGQKVQF